MGAWLQAWKGAPVGLQDQTQQQAAGVAALLLSYLPQMPSICAEPGGARRIRRLPLCPLHLPARLSLVQSWGRMPSRRSWRGTPRPCTSTAPTRWGPGGWQARPAGRGCLFIELWGLPHRHHPPTRRCHTISAAAGGVGRGGGQGRVRAPRRRAPAARPEGGGVRWCCVCVLGQLLRLARFLRPSWVETKRLPSPPLPLPAAAPPAVSAPTRRPTFTTACSKRGWRAGRRPRRGPRRRRRR